MSCSLLFSIYVFFGWDYPCAGCSYQYMCDWLGFHTPPTLLANTYVEKVGINLWSNRTFFQTVQMDGTTSDQQ